MLPDPDDADDDPQTAPEAPVRPGKDADDSDTTAPTALGRQKSRSGRGRAWAGHMRGTGTCRPRARGPLSGQKSAVTARL